MNKNKFTHSDKVTHTDGRKGVFKRYSSRKGMCYVVFNCGHNWGDFRHYDGDAVNINDLEPGWEDFDFQKEADDAYFASRK